jgi:integrase
MPSCPIGAASGTVGTVIQKAQKYGGVPLNTTASEARTNYLPTLPSETAYVFPSGKRGQAGETAGPLGERALVYIICKCAGQARVVDVSPHDLRHPFGYRMARTVPLQRRPNSWDTTGHHMRDMHGTQQDLQQAVETIAWTYPRLSSPTSTETGTATAMVVTSTVTPTPTDTASSFVPQPPL